jgi:hypothetical protein
MDARFDFRRQLTFKIHGEEKHGELFIGDVKPRPDGTWLCHWSISFVHPEVGAQVGDDELDAFYHCVRFVERLIRGSEEDGLQVWWRFVGDHAGFDFDE